MGLDRDRLTLLLEVLCVGRLTNHSFDKLVAGLAEPTAEGSGEGPQRDRDNGCRAALPKAGRASEQDRRDRRQVHCRKVVRQVREIVLQ